MRIVFAFVLFFSSFILNAAPSWAAGESLKNLPVQHGGRVKPYDSYSRETLELLYGRSNYKRTDTNKSEPAYLIVMSMLLSPESWSKIPVIEVNNKDIKDRLKFPDTEKYFTIEQVATSSELANLFQELTDKRESKEKLDPYFQAVQRLENQIYTYNEIVVGAHLKLVPQQDKTEWLSIRDMPESYKNKFVAISTNVAKYLGSLSESDKDSREKNGKALDDAVSDFRSSLQAEYGDKYEDVTRTNAEVFYNDIHFFRWTYIFYLFAALVLLYGWIQSSSKGMKIAWSLAILGFLIHTIGFAFRVYLAKRPPVTNMYETVVWVSWGALVFSMILEKIYEYKSILFVGLLTGIFSMVVADMAPAVLDPSLQPLEAVLRSSYWLIIHVMTITISYSAFFLAFGLGDLGLIYYFLDAEKYKEQIRSIATAIYRAIQIGVAFLTPGIILGGVWADYSWGRFWGWDPKETWALIVLLGYIIILHAKITNWLKNFGMIVSAILAFNLVIMAWYGVNFVLGAGLHSYGFGAGGVEYVSVFVVLHLLAVAFVYFSKRSQKV